MGAIKKILNNKNFRAGGWYTASRFVNKGLAMLITPFLTRMMSTGDYGEFSNFSAWATMVLVVTSLDMANVVIRAKFDYEDRFEGYMSSIVVATFVSSSFFALIIYIFRDFFSGLFGFGDKYIYALIIYFFFKPAIEFYVGQQVARLKYISGALVSLSSSVLILICSLVFVNFMEDKLWARTIGFILVPAVYGVVLYSMIIYKGKKVDLEAIRYTLKLSVPLIPHNLANSILSSSDRIVIKRFWPADDAAFYTIGYSVGNILYLFTQSVAQAYTPWLYDKLNKKEHALVPKVNNYLSVFALLLVCVFVGMAPEAVAVLGGKKYTPSIQIVPIVTVGIFFQFISKLYINIEHYMKITYMISAASLLAALSNVGLNLLLVPKYGFVAAAWTTMVSYGLALILHMIVIIRSRYRELIIHKVQLILCAVSLALIPLSSLLYSHVVYRVVFMAAVLAGTWFMLKKLMKEWKTA